MIQIPKFHANSLNKLIRAYLSNYFNALVFAFNIVNWRSSGDPGSIPGRCQIWAPTVLQSMDKAEQLVPLWKALTYISLEKTIQGSSIGFRAFYEQSN